MCCLGQEAGQGAGVDRHLPSPPALKKFASAWLELARHADQEVACLWSKDLGFDFTAGCHVRMVRRSGRVRCTGGPKRATGSKRTRPFVALPGMRSTGIRPAQTAEEVSDMRTQDTPEQQWNTDPRWTGVKRPYSAEDVAKLRGSFQVEHTLARLGAERLWWLLHNETYVPALGALTGNQAVQQVQAGLKAIYLSGWQVAADANDAGHMYPDQSLYPADSVPNVARRINNALMRADQVHHLDGKNGI